jgi:BirA family transcriptional regulator, biotin operon repressor / biotin---[acetyl-CoA-carboxylase] ligase
MDVEELAERTRQAIEGTRWVLTWVPTTGSTNADLLGAAEAGEPAGRVLVAEHQGAGRGRLDRTWVAPEGSSLLMSVLVRPAVPAEAAHLAAVVVALAAEHACTSVAGVSPGLKWPNDLVIGSGADTRKVGGVLSESLVANGEITAVVIGIGINVNWPMELPADLVGVATSLNAHIPGGQGTGDDIDRVELLAALLTELDSLVDLLDSAAGRARLLDEYRRRCVTIGARVRVEMAGTTIEGTATAIDDDGHLVVTDDDGTAHVVTVGDVIHLRPVV